MRHSLPVLIVLLALPAAAIGQPAPEVRATYETYAVGVPVAALSADFTLGERDYRVAVAFQTSGVIGSLLGGHQVFRAAGHWRGDRPMPSRFAYDGLWHGQNRRTLIEYQAGIPQIRDLVPPNEGEREPVPAELQAHTVDTLSAIAMLIRGVTRTGRCDGELTTFDGRRAFRMLARTVGEEQLASDGRSVFEGRALRCDFEGRMIAGFPRDADETERTRPRRGSAWFASAIPGGPPVPVQISFETRWFGMARMYLTGARTSPETAASR